MVVIDSLKGIHLPFYRINKYYYYLTGTQPWNNNTYKVILKTYKQSRSRFYSNAKMDNEENVHNEDGNVFDNFYL